MQKQITATVLSYGVYSQYTKHGITYLNDRLATCDLVYHASTIAEALNTRYKVSHYGVVVLSVPDDCLLPQLERVLTNEELSKLTDLAVMRNFLTTDDLTELGIK